mmetsp:Transcript_14418/g.21653  ORF Transcript_14418/g.21653 Transcript_14418/m.21653 type:complete len:88 (+) Transcript_14418:214-477(+)
MSVNVYNSLASSSVLLVWLLGALVDTLERAIHSDIFKELSVEEQGQIRAILVENLASVVVVSKYNTKVIEDSALVVVLFMSLNSKLS